MLDIKFIRANPDLVRAAIASRRSELDLDELIKIDDERLKLLVEVERLRAAQNKASQEIAAAGSAKEELLAEMRELKSRLQAVESELKTVLKKWQSLMLWVPNIPDISVPVGESEADNKEIRRWGEPPAFDFPPKNHIELMEHLGLTDLERGTKVSGFRGYFLKGDGALLHFAVLNFVMTEMVKKGFLPFSAPSLVKVENLLATGLLPRGQEEVYKTQDELYLAGTAEVSMTGYHFDETFAAADLPKKYVAYSPCFRREAGSYGKDAKGLFRLHEFAKIEQFVLCSADHEESVRWHEELTRNAEEFLQALGLPYRVMVNCTGDLAQGSVKTYDIETWLPSEKRYRETHSSSYYHDFQARRAGIRYRENDGKLRFVHSLNNTAIASPRILIAIVENHQQADGRIKMPEVLVPYLGKKIIGG